MVIEMIVIGLFFALVVGRLIWERVSGREVPETTPAEEAAWSQAIK